MNYQKHYNLLISTRLTYQEERKTLREFRFKQQSINRTSESYFENHHIIPKCLKGTNNKSNLILLTAREHYTAHWLLSKAYPNENKLSYSLWRLANDNKHKINSKTYQLLKENAFKNGHTEEAKIKIGNAHRGKIVSKETRKKQSDIGKKRIGCLNPMYGKKQSEKTKTHIKNVMNKIDDNGNTKYQNRSIKAAKTMSITQQNGKSIQQEITEKRLKTMSKVLENGKTKYQEMTEKTKKSMLDINRETGLNKYQTIGKNMKGNKHHRFDGYYILQAEKFATTSEAEEATNLNRKLIAKYYKNPNIVINAISYSKSKYFQSIGTKNDIVGKTTSELGFSFEQSN